MYAPLVGILIQILVDLMVTVMVTVMQDAQSAMQAIRPKILAPLNHLIAINATLPTVMSRPVLFKQTSSDVDVLQDILLVPELILAPHVQLAGMAHPRQPTQDAHSALQAIRPLVLAQLP